MRIKCLAVLAVLSLLSLSTSATDTASTESVRNLEGMERLASDTQGSVVSHVNPATGTPRLLRLPSGKLHLDGSSPQEKTLDFFKRYGRAFGIGDPSQDLEFVTSHLDSLGMTHVSLRQVSEGIPVHAAIVRLHFNRDSSLASFNGLIVPDIDIDPSPTLAGPSAAAIARRHLARLVSIPESEIDNKPPMLLVYRKGLATGMPGANHLSWQVEVSHHSGERVFVYVDAHDGSLVDRLPGVYELHRIVHYENAETTIWEEGDPLPFSSTDAGQEKEVNIIIEATEGAFSLFANLSGGAYLSFDGEDAPMRNVYDPEVEVCFGGPNASWNGTVTNYCRGLARDDVVGHEWAHAYTQYTHDLIYRHQPGALNESYSDIFGELVDLAGEGLSAGRPGERSDGGCSTVSGNDWLEVPILEIHEPPSIAGLFVTGSAHDGRDRPWSVTAMVELAEDGEEPSHDGCEPLEGFTPGRIALIDQGGCQWQVKFANAADAGAVGIIAANNKPKWTGTITNVWPDPFPVSGVTVNLRDGSDLKAALPLGVTATISLSKGSSDESVRWVVGQDVSIGAVRDMWNPRCHYNPGRTSEYGCGGGVHYNSGIPNHAFALLVDGGSYNRRTVTAIGATKAAHIYWRAMSVYQGPATTLVEHADFLELSCADLSGSILTDLDTGLASSEVIDEGDCLEVAAAMLAVEMREPLSHCDYTPLLEPDHPTVWGTIVWSEGFDDAAALKRWTNSSEGFDAQYQPKNWQWTTEPSVAHNGGAVFADDRPGDRSCSNLDDDGLSGVMRMQSSSIDLPEGSSSFVLLFDHMVATAQDWDGGNVKLSVNGGAFTLIEGSRFQFNPYNGEIARDNGFFVSTNPLVGEQAFTGIDSGEVIGSWGRSHVDLEGLASPGDSIRVRFDFGRAGCVSRDGWYVDNIKIIATIHPIRTPTRRVGP